jgi:hypothetical protein
MSVGGRRDAGWRYANWNVEGMGEEGEWWSVWIEAVHACRGDGRFGSGRKTGEEVSWAAGEGWYCWHTGRSACSFSSSLSDLDTVFHARVTCYPALLNLPGFVSDVWKSPAKVL